jgi:hypothetical protein
MVAVYRHDVHKLRLRAHDNAAETVAGSRVNESIESGADGDAALLSRPAGEPEHTLDNHDSPYRRSMVTGEVATSAQTAGGTLDAAVSSLLAQTTPAQAHAWWLTSPEPALIAESIFYPYTSLKYHTLLVAALHHQYRDGAGFDELWCVIEPTGTVTPHETILATDAWALAITDTPAGRPAARLGETPARSFADVWARLSAHPFNPDDGRAWRVLDAQLRRIQSWSTALQYIAEFVARFTPVTPASTRKRDGGAGRGV